MAKTISYAYKKSLTIPQVVSVQWTFVDLFSLFIKALLVCFAFFALWKGNVVQSFQIGAFWLILHALTIVPKYIPQVLHPFIAIAVLLNTGGWIFGFFIQYDFLYYDKFVHASTTFVVAGVIGHFFHIYLNKRRTLLKTVLAQCAFIIVVSSLVIALGAWWEVIEWGGALVLENPNLQESMGDALSDIIVNSGGAISGSVMISRIVQTMHII